MIIFNLQNLININYPPNPNELKMRFEYRKEDVVLFLEGHDLEMHVENVLYLARNLTTSRRLDAGIILNAIKLKYRHDPSVSEAFSWLIKVLPSDNDSDEMYEEKQLNTKSEKLPPPDLSELVLVPELAESFEIADKFIGYTSIWGRDLITIAILAKNDPSLNRIAEKARLSVKELQDLWYGFVTSGNSENHRHWDEWWLSAGVQIPRKEEKTSGESSRTFLLTWNPNDYKFLDLDDRINQINETGYTNFEWSTGNRKDFSAGERVFLMRQGVEPRGLIGSGYIIRQAGEDMNSGKTKSNRRRIIAEIRWDTLQREPIIPLEELIRVSGDEEMWKARASGIQIEKKITQELERIWAERAGKGDTGDSMIIRPGIASIDSDSVSADATDYLNVENEAKAFARVAASIKVHPPLSIGIFGEWGSGKTFFMEKIKAHVEKLSEVGAAAKKENKPTAYHSDIVQIRFNAWHYMETNLWASLVDHIFREMDKWMHNKETEASKIDALYERLSTARMLQFESLTELIEARRRRIEAEKQVTQLRQELMAKESKKNTLKITDFWNAVNDTLTETLGEDEKEKIKQAAQSLGFYDIPGSAKELMEALSKVRDQSVHSQMLVRYITGRLKNPVWVIILIALLVFIPILFPFLLEYLKELFPEQFIRSLIDKINSTTLAISSALAAVTAWLGKALNMGYKAIRRLSTFKNNLDEKLKEKKTPQPILQIDQIIENQRKEVEISESNLEKAINNLEKVRTDFGDTASTRLNRFIRNKITEGEYAKHLGIIANVRKDFEELAALMVDVADNQILMKESEKKRLTYARQIEALNLENVKNEGLITDEEKKKIETTLEQKDKDLKFFQRVILYIDDLDRCPPDKVVEVLQACHLLLYFPLFIVVVAVDARWVSRALLKQYNGLLDADQPFTGDNKLANETTFDESASPRDYLEKIFQIPYWVRQMYDEASKDFTRALIGEIEDTAEYTHDKNKENAEQYEISRNQQKSGIDGTLQGKIPENTIENSSLEKIVPKDTLNNELPDGTKTRTNEDIDYNNQEDKHEYQQTPEPIDPNPVSLLLTNYEAEFLTLLSPYSGQSPRTIKRFVNVYRLLRAGLPDETIQVLVGKKGESLVYRAIIAQLAIVTGAPTLANMYFTELGPPNRDDNMTNGQLLDKLKNNNQLLSSPEKQSVLKPLEILKTIEDSSEMMMEMRNRANIVKRYSFSNKHYLY